MSDAVSITLEIHEPGRPAETRTFAVGVVKIGRDVKSHLRLAHDSGASRMHAVIEAPAGVPRIIDLGSGTRVNGKAADSALLAVGDRVVVGDVELRVLAINALPTRGAPQERAQTSRSTPAASPGGLRALAAGVVARLVRAARAVEASEREAGR